ncbi:MAG: dihydropteroate synthase [Saprospiraceae bacterium]|nr:dihydropteroate synthase [Saprospiraceae bacterium]
MTDVPARLSGFVAAGPVLFIQGCRFHDLLFIFLQLLKQQTKIVTTINCRGSLVDLSMPKVMGIINVNDDSFYSGSRFTGREEIRRRATQMAEEGATWVDLGAMSSRPGAELIDPALEWQVLQPALEAVLEVPGLLVSIDTVWSLTASRCIEAGAHVINDISAGTIDPEMMDTVAAYADVPYIAMHMRGTPKTMKELTTYDDLLLDLLNYFAGKIHEAHSAGIKDVVIDPGFGFAKTLEQNYTILKNLRKLCIFGAPVLAGLSRKSMLYKLTSGTPGEALNATSVANTIAVMNGAAILRVHDVKEAVEVVKVCGMATR